MIGTSRQDGFMHYRNVVCFWLVRCFYRRHGDVGLMSGTYIYQKQGKGVVYLRPYEKTNFRYIETLLFR